MRWMVAVLGAAALAALAATLTDAPPGPVAGPEAAGHVLALSWQPAFCEQRPETAECRALNAGDLPAAEARLSLHGLWPQPEDNLYCGVAAEIVALDEASRWADLPPVALDDDTRAALEAAMPGTASFLDRHEWIKHGTCHGGAGAADEYFDDTLRLLDAVNAAVAGFLAARAGSELRTDELRRAFDAAFGSGAGERVGVRCADDGGRRLVQEIRMATRGVIGPDSDVGALLLAADPVPPGCPGGVIDRAGLQ